MIVLDLLIVLMFAYGLFKGLKNGFIISVISLIALIAGAYIALRFSFHTKAFLEQQVDWSPNALTITAFLTTFLLVLIGLHLLGKILTKMIDVLALGFLNKLAGALFEAVKVLMIILVIFHFFEKINENVLIVSDEHLQKSFFYPYIQKTSKVFYPLLQQWFPSQEAVYIRTN